MRPPSHPPGYQADTYTASYKCKNCEREFIIRSTPTWAQLGDKQREIDELHAENALKLTQILDLEQLLYDMRDTDLKDDSPCWCFVRVYARGNDEHSLECIKARRATEPFWKK